MSATLNPPLHPKGTAGPGPTPVPSSRRRQRAGHDETFRSSARLLRARLATTPVVPTDCATCLSAGSVRRGICEICGAVS